MPTKESKKESKWVNRCKDCGSTIITYTIITHTHSCTPTAFVITGTIICDSCGNHKFGKVFSTDKQKEAFLDAVKVWNRNNRVSEISRLIDPIEKIGKNIEVKIEASKGERSR